MSCFRLFRGRFTPPKNTRFWGGRGGSPGGPKVTLKVTLLALILPCVRIDFWLKIAPDLSVRARAPKLSQMSSGPNLRKTHAKTGPKSMRTEGKMLNFSVKFDQNGRFGPRTPPPNFLAPPPNFPDRPPKFSGPRSSWVHDRSCTPTHHLYFYV